MTKHVADEGLPKLHVSLEDADKLVEANVELLDCQTLGICSTHINPMQPAPAENRLMKPRAAKIKLNVVKNRLGKIMHKLYDLEPDNAPEKPLNVDLCVDLYQMEKY